MQRIRMQRRIARICGRSYAPTRHPIGCPTPAPSPPTAMRNILRLPFSLVVVLLRQSSSASQCRPTRNVPELRVVSGEHFSHVSTSFYCLTTQPTTYSFPRNFLSSCLLNTRLMISAAKLQSARGEYCEKCALKGKVRKCMLFGHG